MDANETKNGEKNGASETIIETIQAEEHAEQKEKAMAEDLSIESLDLYESLLEEAARRSSVETFPNSGKEHAARAMGILFRHTKKTLRLIATDFNGSVSNNIKYVDGLKYCLENNEVNISILTLEEPKNSGGYQLFLNYQKKYPERVTIKTASQASIDILQKHINKDVYLGELFNLGLFDDNKYRIEILPSEYSAFISFNCPEKVDRYGRLFGEAFAATP